MQFLIKFWYDFKLQPDIWFFYGFLLTFTLSVRKVLFFYPINGQFNEWTGIYLYLSDILLIITIFLWGISILRNKNVNLSTPLETHTGYEIQPHKSSMFLPSHSKPQDMFLTGSIDNIYLWLKQAKISLPLLLVVWSFISILWSENQNIALFKAIKLLEFYFLYLYVIFRIIPAKIKLYSHKCHPEHSEGSRTNIASANSTGFLTGLGMTSFFKTIIILGFIQAITGIWQFIIQHSVDLFWLKESLISPNIPGVAKIVLNGEKFIRAYGLFPHPNILGGFLLISIIITWAYYKMFHPVNFNFVPHGTKLKHGASVEQLDICHPELDSGSNEIPGPQSLRRGKQARNDIYLVPGMTVLLVVQVIVLILTFSKSAILGLIIAIIYIIWKNKERLSHFNTNVPRGTLCGIGVKKLLIMLAVIIFLAYISLDTLGLNFGENLEKSYGDRIDQLEIWKSTTQNNLLLGVGIGNHLFHMKHLYPNLETWQYQPVHNVFLLILSELGFVGVFIFVWFLWKLFHPVKDENVSRETFSSYGAGVEQENKCHPERSEAESKDLTQLDSSTTLGMTFFRSILLAFIFIMLFDHYLWDIQQGQTMLWLALGFVAGFAEKK